MLDLDGEKFALPPKVSIELDRYINFWKTPFGPLGTIAVILAVISIFRPIGIATASLLGFAALPWLLDFIEELELPGGIKVTARKFKKVTEDAKRAGLLDGKNKEHRAIYIKIYEQDPQLALAGLRIELEKKLFELYEQEGFTIHPDKAYGIKNLLETLSDKGVLRPEEVSVINDLLPLLNKASHARKIDADVADWAIDVGPKLISSLGTSKITVGPNPPTNPKKNDVWIDTA